MSLPEDPDQTLARVTRTLQIIVIAQLIGLTVFAGIAALVIRPQMARKPAAVAGTMTLSLRPSGSDSAMAAATIVITTTVTAGAPKNQATPTAPAPSTTSFVRSSSNMIARAIASSPTVTVSSTRRSSPAFTR